MKLLGISCFYHDSAACLVEDGRVVAAAQEERFTRKKHDEGFPHHAVRGDIVHASRSADAQAAVGQQLYRVAAGNSLQVDERIGRSETFLNADQQVRATTQRQCVPGELVARVSE